VTSSPHDPEFRPEPQAAPEPRPVDETTSAPASDEGADAPAEAAEETTATGSVEEPGATDAEATAEAEEAPTSGEDPGSEGEAAAEPAPADDVTTVGHVRRAPRYGRFIWVGFLLGLLASILLVILTNGASFSEGYDGVQNSQFFADTLSDKNAVGLLLLSLGPLGMRLGALVAYLLDRRSLRRRDRAIADLTDDGPDEK
jgi:hypothetical protein